MNLTEYGNNRANASLSDTPQVFTVDAANGGYRLSALSNGRQYYLDEHNGTGGNGFAGYAGQSDNGILTFNFTQPIFNGNDSYMTLVKYGDKYYIVNNDATLTEIGYIEGTQEVYVENPMEWDVEDGHLYYNNKEMGFDDRQLPSGFYRMYLDPSKSTPLTEENSENIAVKKIRSYPVPNSNPPTTYDEVVLDVDNGGRNEMLAATAVNITQTAGKETYSISHYSDYLGVELEDGVPVRLTGNQSAENAAEFLFAKPKMNVSDWKQHTVNHIDISISGTANVKVPLAYGNYYGENGDQDDPIKVVSNNTKLLLTEANLVNPNQIKITTDDLKRVTITTARADNGVEVENAFYITGYSGNATSAYSDNQVRIEGAFLVADLRGTEYETVDANQYNNPWNQDYRNAVNEARKNNKIEYTVTVVKSLTYYLVDPEVGQLFDEAGEKITVTVDVAFSASFNYWDDPNANPKPSNGGNECPPLQPGNPYWNGGYDAWQSGEIWQVGEVGGNGGSGMDFALGGDAENLDSPLVALEITKVIQDEAGNQIELKTPVYNYFEIYEKKGIDAKPDNDPAASENNASVVGLHEVDDNNHPVWSQDQRDGSWLDEESGYQLWKTKRIKVDETGSAIVFDYNASDAMYYIVEQHDEESLPRTIVDKNGDEWHYVKTYIETEYVRRDSDPFFFDEYSNKVTHPNAMHITDEYSKVTDSYASIPEVAGNFLMMNGYAKKEGFLEFYVYNVYKKINIDIIKYEEGSSPVKHLKGAEFTLTQINDVVELTIADDGISKTETTDTNGKASFEGLTDGYFKITETKAPETYCILEDNEIYVKIENGKVTYLEKEDNKKPSEWEQKANSNAISFGNVGETIQYGPDASPMIIQELDNATFAIANPPQVIELIKIAEGGESVNYLEGAGFTLSKLDKDRTSISYDNTFTPIEEETKKTNDNPLGKIVFKELASGYYEVKETKVPAGYVIVNDAAFYFKIEDGDVVYLKKKDNTAPSAWEEETSGSIVFGKAGGTITYGPTGHTVTLTDIDNATFVVSNPPGAALPNTGGPGTRFFKIFGSILILGAGVLLWRRRILI